MCVRVNSKLIFKSDCARVKLYIRYVKNGVPPNRGRNTASTCQHYGNCRGAAGLAVAVARGTVLA